MAKQPEQKNLSDNELHSLTNPTQKNMEFHPLAQSFLWLADKKIQNGFILIPLLGMLICIFAGLFFPPEHKAPWDFFGSWALIGFIAYSFVVLSASPLFLLLARSEDYYGDDEIVGEHIDD